MKEVSEDKKTQFRWSKPMSKELLKFLADEVKKGNQPNNTFKSSSFVAVADTISKIFNVKCLPDHVDNHLRTVKTAWGIIAKLRNQSDCGWDENMRMIRMSPDVYNTYVEANPTHEKYLNKKIDMYDEMATAVGNDIAQGSGAKSFDDVEIQSLEAWTREKSSAIRSKLYDQIMIIMATPRNNIDIIIIKVVPFAIPIGHPHSQQVVSEQGGEVSFCRQSKTTHKERETSPQESEREESFKSEREVSHIVLKEALVLNRVVVGE
ncbi:hypothetical protein Cgig2_012853 [Carnegiea gigantea]|uniref:Myb/SANT-like domain-containing protein n=1 Tax=Carnegiea gigantea TaxID=171969 RepID=A0A9Q1GU53_9CARY|nr:hypothetical protein Cgig2_012853 [Carnegiea gigantea]